MRTLVVTALLFTGGTAPRCETTASLPTAGRGTALAGKCPTINGTFEKAQNYGTSAISIHVRRGKNGTELSRDNIHFYPANGSKHVEQDEQFGDSEVSFECRKGSIVIHQNLVKLGLLLPSNKPLPRRGIVGTMTLKPAGKNAIMVTVTGNNPVLKLVEGGKFKRK